jgi:hypothetical protein
VPRFVAHLTAAEVLTFADQFVAALAAVAKRGPDHILEQKNFLESQLQPRLDGAVAERRQVFFVDPSLTTLIFQEFGNVSLPAT